MLNWVVQSQSEARVCKKPHGAVLPFVSKFTIAAKTHKPLEQSWVLITPCLFRLVKENTLTVSCSQWSRTSKDMELRVLVLGLQEITMT